MQGMETEISRGAKTWVLERKKDSSPDEKGSCYHSPSNLSRAKHNVYTRLTVYWTELNLPQEWWEEGVEGDSECYGVGEQESQGPWLRSHTRSLLKLLHPHHVL